MSKKLVFLDVDGTLTEPGSNEPPSSALEAVRRARERGHLVYLCSGRNRGMLKPLLRYPWDGYISSAGGYVVSGGRVIYDLPFTREQQHRAAEILKRNGIYLTIECLDATYTDERFKEYLKEHAHEEGKSELLRWRVEVERSLGMQPMENYREEACYKMVMMMPDSSCLAEPRALLESEFQFVLHVLDEENLAGFVNAEMFLHEYDKGSAAKLVANDMGISMEDTIGFGDSMNDLAMLRQVGTSVCMGNGSKQLQQVAAYVCPTVAEDGLYKAFEKYGLI